MKLSKSLLISLTLLVLSLCGCSYGFSGASIDYNTTKTVSIANFFNDAVDGGLPNMGQTFTEDLKGYFQRNTKLELIPSKGDLQFEGAISQYNIAPQAVISSGNQNVADRSGLMRLTIGVEVAFTNVNKEDENFKRTFSFYADYDPQTTSLTTVEPELVSQIFKEIILDIFQQSVAQW
ncbi:LptE family protein [Roseivirga sp.]|uniref:LptE family protein n=1 Tax=Roseivirga sp. TaxID=1964215 RepID=UPI002B27692A|nr:LptE family protein [Roseivirga sp.]